MHRSEINLPWGNICTNNCVHVWTIMANLTSHQKEVLERIPPNREIYKRNAKFKQKLFNSYSHFLETFSDEIKTSKVVYNQCTA